MSLFCFRGPQGDQAKASRSKAVEKLQDASEQAPSTSQQESDILPPPPANSFQLEADLRKIGERPEMIYRYLKVCTAANALSALPGEQIYFCLSFLLNKHSILSLIAFCWLIACYTDDHLVCRN